MKNKLFVMFLTTVSLFAATWEAHPTDGNIRYYHSRNDLKATCAGERISKIEGIEFVSATERYSVLVKKAMLFSWNEVNKKIMKELEKKGVETCNFSTFDKSCAWWDNTWRTR